MLHESFSKPRVDRRTAIAFGFGSAAWFLSGCGPTPPAVPTRQPDVKSTVLPKGKEFQLIVPPPVTEPFMDSVANEEAKKAAVSMETFLLPGEYPETLDRLAGFRVEKLLPIWTPSVTRWAQLIDEMSKEFRTPPNIVASLIAIESLGDQRAGEAEPDPQRRIDHVGLSLNKAIGLFQPLSDKFPSSIQEIKDPVQRLTAMQNPNENARAGMKYFTQVCLPTAQKEFSGRFPPTHVLVYARAFMYYNAGPGWRGTQLENLPQETQLYRHHFIRHAMAGEVAARLWQLRKYDDPAIRRALQSEKIDALAYAFYNFHTARENEQRGYSVGEYERIMSFLAKPTNESAAQISADVAKQLSTDVNTYRSDASNRYALPLSPNMRIWNSMGGVVMFLHPRVRSINMNPSNW